MTHRSYTQLTSYTHCGKQFQLTRIMHAPERPAWWLVGGKAFHGAMEYVNYGGTIEDPRAVWEFFWDQEFQAAALKTNIPPDLWRAAGRKTKDKPNGEDAAWWDEAGPKMIWDYAAWLGGMEEQGWEIAVLPDGRMAIESEFNALFGDVSVKAYMDVAFAKGPDLLVVDAKTGSKPDSPAQLGLYACSLERTWSHFRPNFGSYYMARDGEATAAVDLSRFTVDMYAEQFAQLDRGITQKIFLPNLGRMCGTCSVNRYCAAYGGDLAHEYDPLAKATSHQESA